MNTLQNLVSGLLGAIIGGVVSFCIASMQLKTQNEHACKSREFERSEARGNLYGEILKEYRNYTEVLSYGDERIANVEVYNWKIKALNRPEVEKKMIKFTNAIKASRKNKKDIEGTKTGGKYNLEFGNTLKELIEVMSSSVFPDFSSC